MADFKGSMMETEFTPVASLLGGMMIGGAAVLLLLATGRIAGISGLASNVLPPFPDADGKAVASLFLAGLLAAPLLYAAAMGAFPVQTVGSNLPLMAIGGLLVGLGTRLGGGCTSGHGVCGLSRLSQRSSVATATFMLAGFVTVAILRHGL